LDKTTPPPQTPRLHRQRAHREVPAGRDENDQGRSAQELLHLDADRERGGEVARARQPGYGGVAEHLDLVFDGPRQRTRAAEQETGLSKGRIRWISAATRLSS
jgi:hypothetical protein